MLSKKHYINIFSLFILSIITFININRLTSHRFDSPFLLSIIYIVFFLALIFFVDKKSKSEILQNYLPVLISVYVLLPYLLITYATSMISAQSRWTEILIIIYVIIIITSVILLNKYSAFQKFDVYFFAYSLLYGFLFAISEETWFLLLIGIFFLYRSSIPKILLFGILAVVFGLLIPFVYQLLGLDFNFKLFFPETSFGLKAFIIILSAYTGWIVSDIQEVFFGSGIILFLYLLFTIMSGGYEWKFYLGDDTFPSFFIAVVPFLLLAIKKYRVEKFVGKILTEK